MLKKIMLKKVLFATLFAVAALNVNQIDFQNNSLLPQIHLTNQASAETPYQQGYKHGRLDAQWGTAFGDNMLYQMASPEWQRGYSDGYRSVR